MAVDSKPAKLVAAVERPKPNIPPTAANRTNTSRPLALSCARVHLPFDIILSTRLFAASRGTGLPLLPLAGMVNDRRRSAVLVLKYSQEQRRKPVPSKERTSASVGHEHR